MRVVTCAAVASAAAAATDAAANAKKGQKDIIQSERRMQKERCYTCKCAWWRVKECVGNCHGCDPRDARIVLVTAGAANVAAGTP
jgi:hypothetical protein